VEDAKKQFHVLAMSVWCQALTHDFAKTWNCFFVFHINNEGWGASCHQKMARKNKAMSMIAGNMHVLPAITLHISLHSWSFFNGNGVLISHRGWHTHLWGVGKGPGGSIRGVLGFCAASARLTKKIKVCSCQITSLLPR
jgi:hypothetical protein